MPDQKRIEELTRLLAGAGRAHHEAVGGPNPGWPEWYAQHLLDHGIADHLGFEPTLSQLADWLQRADEKHRAEAPESPWPPYYAELIEEFLEER